MAEPIPGERDQVFAKCAKRLIPFMMLLYVTNYLGRVNVGFAALTMNKDLGFSASVYGFAAGIFFLSYAVFQIPGTVILERGSVTWTGASKLLRDDLELRRQKLWM